MAEKSYWDRAREAVAQVGEVVGKVWTSLDNGVRGAANAITSGYTDDFAGAASTALTATKDTVVGLVTQRPTPKRPSVSERIKAEKEISAAAANEGDGVVNAYNAGAAAAVVVPLAIGYSKLWRFDEVKTELVLGLYALVGAQNDLTRRSHDKIDDYERRLNISSGSSENSSRENLGGLSPENKGKQTSTRERTAGQ